MRFEEGDGEPAWDLLSLRCEDVQAGTHSFVRKVFIEHLLCTTHCSKALRIQQ